MSVSMTGTEASAIEEVCTKQAHEWALGVTVAEALQQGTPIIAAIEEVAKQSGESFSTVFGAACNVAANSL